MGQRRALCDIAFPGWALPAKRRIRPCRSGSNPSGKSAKKRMEKLKELFADSSADLLSDMETVRPVVEELLRLVADFDARLSPGEAAAQPGGLLRPGAPVPPAADRGGTARPALWPASGRSALPRSWWTSTRTPTRCRTPSSALSAAGGGGCSMVGDVKQSIYRFRLADPTIFLDKYLSFPDAEAAQPGSPGGWCSPTTSAPGPRCWKGSTSSLRTLCLPPSASWTIPMTSGSTPRLPLSGAAGDQVELDVVDLSALDREKGEAKVSRDAAEAGVCGPPGAPAAGQRLSRHPGRASAWCSLRTSPSSPLPGAVMGHLTRALGTGTGCPGPATGRGLL